MTAPAGLVDAIRYLAGRCDWARTEDGMGFSGTDTTLGHRLAEYPADLWDESMIELALGFALKYRGQLEPAGFDVEEITDGAPADIAQSVRDEARAYMGVLYARRKAEEAKTSRKIEREGAGVRVSFEYDRDLVDLVKRSLAERRFDWDSKGWDAPLVPGNVEGLLALVDEHGFACEGALRAEIAKLGSVPARRVELVGDVLRIYFPFDRALVDSIKAEGFARFQNDDGDKHWSATLSQTDRVLAWAIEGGFDVPAELADVAEEVAAEREGAIEASRAADADLEEIDGLGGTLFPFQRGGVAYALRKRRTFVADEMGLGKTIQALVTLEAADAFPAAIVVPTVVLLNWKREADKWLPHRRAAVYGSEDWQDADVVLVSYATLARRKEGELFRVEEIRALGLAGVVLDESHYVKNRKALRTKAVLALVEDVEVRLALTGTPMLSRPAELPTQLQALGRLDEFGGAWRFLQRYTNAYRNRYGWDFSGASHLDELNEKLRETCYVRRMKADVLTELPPKMTAVVPLEIDNRAEYRKADLDLRTWLVDEGGKSKGEAARTMHAEHLAKIEYLKQVSARGKREAVGDWVENFIDTNGKLVVFATHREEQQALFERFSDRAVRIAGDDAPEARQAAVEAFQNDDSVRLMVASLKAGGVGITLTAASHVAFVEFGWTPADHDQAIDRVHRIGQDADSVTAYYLVGVDTIDEAIVGLVESKREVVAAATEGGEAVAETGIMRELLAHLKEGR
jgi:superfamily II DNA or RNA helicase